MRHFRTLKNIQAFNSKISMQVGTQPLTYVPEKCGYATFYKLS